MHTHAASIVLAAPELLTRRSPMERDASGGRLIHDGATKGHFVDGFCPLKVFILERSFSFHQAISHASTIEYKRNANVTICWTSITTSYHYGASTVWHSFLHFRFELGSRPASRYVCRISVIVDHLTT